MDDISYGAYNFYFSLVSNSGSFPFEVDNRGNKIIVSNSWPYWLYCINFGIALFHCSYQVSQFFFHCISGSESGVLLIAQMSWILLSFLPLANYYFMLNNEDHFAEIVDEWCQLERRIIGSAMRGLNFGTKKHIPQLSLCHTNQTRRFYFISRYYLILGVIGGIGIGMHAYYEPRYPGYLYWLSSEDSDILRNLSVAFQLWVYFIIWGSIFTIEVLTVAISSSVAHILENLSYRAGVVMTRWTCDEVRITDLIGNKEEVASVMSAMSMGFDLTKKDPMNNGNVVAKTVDELKSDLVFTKSDMSRVVKNLVDIEYGLEGYHRVESLVDAYNFSYGKVIAGHQFVYLLMLTIQGYNAINRFSIMDPRAVELYLLLIVLFLARIIIFFPAMGNLDHRSDSFIDSWMEGLRYIPRGKEHYELYWFRVKSCRLLDFRCGRFFNMERQTCLEFLFRVSEFVIVLLQMFP
ncbi:unnamed protein product [Orchesella dallaii]|uniref:Odorant receptor n=1 Tax=Orchesella dallaii TaxID=48710 RepID=A0ABP1QX88_9HEXA